MAIKYNDAEVQFTKVVPSEYKDQMSNTSLAKDCFANQKFSRKLQTFMVDYSLKAQSIIPITMADGSTIE